MTRIDKLSPSEAAKMLEGIAFSEVEQKTMDFCLLMSTTIWGGYIEDKLICIWGVIPPTLMSYQAYLWLYTTDHLKEHQFIFVRHSQLVIEQVLKEYPSIVGHVVIGADKSIRWLKWLGAKFSEPQGKLIPFRIKRHG